MNELSRRLRQLRISSGMSQSEVGRWVGLSRSAVTQETGSLLIVNRNSSPEERQFWMAHGLAHLLFEPERRWLVCSRDDLSRRHEVRANAFAGRFLMPTRGVERYLHSTGRDTMGSTLGGVLEVFSDRAAAPKDFVDFVIGVDAQKRARAGAVVDLTKALDCPTNQDHRRSPRSSVAMAQTFAPLASRQVTAGIRRKRPKGLHSEPPRPRRTGRPTRAASAQTSVGWQYCN